MRAVVEALLDRGWHPRHIAGLIRSKFERDHGWGGQWREYSPAMRADFYARIFSARRASACREAGEVRAAEAGLFPRGVRPVAAPQGPIPGGTEVLRL
jgi:hypothetical protein